MGSYKPFPKFRSFCPPPDSTRLELDVEGSAEFLQFMKDLHFVVQATNPANLDDEIITKDVVWSWFEEAWAKVKAVPDLDHSDDLEFIRVFGAKFQDVE